MRVCVLLVAIVLACASSAIAQVRSAPDPAVSCNDTVTGTVSTLIVPTGATCIATNVAVTGDVIVEQDATLQSLDPAQCDPASANSFSVAGKITIGPGGTLSVRSTALAIGGDIRAQSADALLVRKVPCQDATGVVGGSIVAGGTKAVSLLGLQVSGSVFVGTSGDEGLEVGDNTIGGALSVQNNTVVGAEHPSLFAVHYNAVSRGIIVVGNDASGAYVPPFVGGNTIVTGNLICEHNLPELTDQNIDETLPNTVLRGKKLGQCEGL